MIEIHLLELNEIESNKKIFYVLFNRIFSENLDKYMITTEKIEQKLIEMKKYIEDGSAIIYGAFEGNNLVGFIWGYKYIYMGELRIHSSYGVVLPEAEKNLVGMLLSLKLIDKAKEIGAKAIDAMVTESNRKLVKYHKLLGFKTERLYMVQYLE